MKKKFLALVMTLSMVLSLVPMTALATEGNTASATQEGQSVAADAIGNSTEGNAATSGSPGEDPNPDGNDIGDSGKSDGDAGNENTSGNDADSSTNPDASGGNDASEGEAGSEGEGETGNEGDSGDSNIEYPKETCTVDYSKTQSPFVTLSEVTGTWKDKNSVYEVTYTIAEGAPKDLVIDFTQAYELCVKKYRADSRWYFGPGDSIKVKIKIVNNSSNDYIYKNNSFVSAPQDTTLFGSIEEKNVYPDLTYDGQLMPIALSTALLPDYFYDGLFEKERASKVSFEEMCQLYEKLEEKGCPKVVVCDLAREDMAEAVEDAFRYGKLVLASITYNGEAFPFMRTFIENLTERNYQNRTIGLIENGSWAPTAAKVMKGMFEKSKNITWLENNVKIMSSLSDENVAEIDAMAEELCK